MGITARNRPRTRTGKPNKCRLSCSDAHCIYFLRHNGCTVGKTSEDCELYSGKPPSMLLILSENAAYMREAKEGTQIEATHQIPNLPREEMIFINKKERH
jgi:hypothetical protein